MTATALPLSNMLFPLAHLRGGGRFVLHDIKVMAWIEQMAQYKLGPHVFFRDLFPAGVIASSGGAFATYAAFANDPNDPSRPRYNMTAFTDVFRDNLHAFLPKEDADTRRALIQFLIRQLSQFMPIISRRPLLTASFTHAMDIAAYGAAWALNAPTEIKDFIHAHNRDARKILRAYKDDVSTSRQSAATVLHDLIGDTKFSDTNSNIVITSQKLGANNSLENDHFAFIQPDHLRQDQDAPTTFQINGDHRFVDAILATTAVPLVFTMDDDKHIDTSPFMQGPDMVATFKRCCHFGSDLGYVRFGNINGSLADTLPHGMRGVLMSIAGMFSDSARNTLRETVGPQNAHFLEYRLPSDFKGTRSFLDPSPKQMDILVATSDKLIADDHQRLGLLTDTLILAYKARQARMHPQRAVA
ncbi:MAG: hypothetical protein V4621_04380 [Pseudomonadota bacterium]